MEGRIENHWNFSGAQTDPLTIMRTVLHLVNITLIWTHCRKSCLHYCFQGNYINTYPFLLLFLIIFLYKAVTVSHSLVPLSVSHFVFCSFLVYFSLAETVQELICYWKFFSGQYCTWGFTFVAWRSNTGISAT